MNAGCAGKTEVAWEHVPYLSTLEVWSRQGAIQIHVSLTLPYKVEPCMFVTVSQCTCSLCYLCNSWMCQHGNVAPEPGDIIHRQWPGENDNQSALSPSLTCCTRCVFILV